MRERNYIKPWYLNRFFLGYQFDFTGFLKDRIGLQEQDDIRLFTTHIWEREEQDPDPNDARPYSYPFGHDFKKLKFDCTYELVGTFYDKSLICGIASSFKLGNPFFWNTFK